jgi:hypothetical protein
MRWRRRRARRRRAVVRCEVWMNVRGFINYIARPGTYFVYEAFDLSFDGASVSVGNKEVASLRWMSARQHTQ